MCWLYRFVNWILRAYQPEDTQARAAISCTHRLTDGSSAWTACHWRAKGTTPGYKGAGYYTQCRAWCGVFRPC